MGRGRESGVGGGGEEEGGRESGGWWLGGGERGMGEREREHKFFLKLFICIFDLFHIWCVGINKHVSTN